MFSASGRPKLGHSDLVSPGKRELAERCLTAKLEVSSCNGYDLCSFNYMKNHVSSLYEAQIRSQ